MPSDSDAAAIAASLDDPGCFGAVFDRHATVVFRYLEKRATYDGERPNARPWLYGIATNLLRRHQRSEARRMSAVARLLARLRPTEDPADQVVTSVDARDLWPPVAEATDLEGHRCYFGERFDDIRARGGSVPDSVSEHCD